jgi:hypothetical protein
MLQGTFNLTGNLIRPEVSFERLCGMTTRDPQSVRLVKQSR